VAGRTARNAGAPCSARRQIARDSEAAGRTAWRCRVTVRDLENRTPGRLPLIFSSFDGDFALTDLPAGKYALDFQSLGTAASWPLRGRIDAFEIRPGSIYGPLTVVLTAPGR